MTVQDLAKLLNTHISQGRAHHQVTVFQWQHSSQPLTDLEPRDACGELELYSNTGHAPETDVDDLL